jgi:hypothetical protein
MPKLLVSPAELLEFVEDVHEVVCSTPCALSLADAMSRTEALRIWRDPLTQDQINVVIENWLTAYAVGSEPGRRLAIEYPPALIDLDEDGLVKEG